MTIIAGGDQIRRDRLSQRERSKTTIGQEIRSEFERDVDRVYYNYYFRRLAEVTQVSSDHGPLLRHNRMTHSLKVAQVGRRLVQYLKHDPSNLPGIAAARDIDADVVAAAGLLHDIGHPPFGHIGEQELDLLARKHGLTDGYEGNAQTLRIILNLVAHTAQESEKADLDYGLDLTRAVVAACVKYPWPSSTQRDGKWGFYTPEEALFERFVAPALPGPETASLEAKLMDWADDITYAVHDLQDFFMSGIIPLYHLRHTHNGAVHQGEFSDFWQYVTEKLRIGNVQSSNDARRVFQRYAVAFPERPFSGSRQEISQVGALASKIITDASKATSVRSDGALYVERDMRSLINALKQVTWYYVIDRPELISTQLGQRTRINQMFHKLLAWVSDAFLEARDGRPLSLDEQWIQRRKLPASLREFTEQLLAANEGRGAYRTPAECFARAVIDHIASMTEAEFYQLHRRLCVVDDTSGSLHG